MRLPPRNSRAGHGDEAPAPSAARPHALPVSGERTAEGFYWGVNDEHLSRELVKALESNPDVIIISTGHTEYKKKETISMIMSLPHLFIFDTIGSLDIGQLERLKEKHNVSVLGRGDLK